MGLNLLKNNNTLYIMCVPVYVLYVCVYMCVKATNGCGYFPSTFFTLFIVKVAFLTEPGVCQFS